jgi:hypothetical protein
MARLVRAMTGRELTVADSAEGATPPVPPASGGAGIAFATIIGATANVTCLLGRALT